MEFLVGALIVVLLVRWAILRANLREIGSQLQNESEQRSALEARVAKLTQRVAELELRPAQAVEATALAARTPEPMLAPAIAEPAAKPAFAPPPIERVAVRICQFCGREVRHGAAICFCGAVIDAAALVEQERKRPPGPPPLPPPIHAQPAEEFARMPLVDTRGSMADLPLVDTHGSMADLPLVDTHGSMAEVQSPRESLRDRLRKRAGDQEWEAIVGGNWLNKVGVLVLVIGITLLLGYEFGRVGPWGRVAIGLGVSLTMLTGGMLVERKAIYRIFARGLIGGGWATLYFTVFAMHALPTARVIEDPFMATALLLAVAAGMIAHSLRYRSQTVSGLAYFIAFGTLALADNTTFAVLAVIPLAISLLTIAYRFEWSKMAVFGLLATYATCASRPDTGAPLAATQALFASYWVLFEVFDILRVRRGRRGFQPESLILPLNAAGFLTLSIVKWHRVAEGNLWMLLAAGAVAYLASALLRAAIARPSSFAEEENTIYRAASGGYEGPITLCAALAAISIFRKAPGMWINGGLLIEGQLLFLAGYRLGESYLRQLAGVVFGASLAKLLAEDVPAQQKIQIANRQWLLFSPVTMASAALFYFNRWLKTLEGPLYSSAAAALIALVLAYETPQQYAGAAWLALATILFEIGFRTAKQEFFLQSFAIGGLGTLAGFAINLRPAPEGWHYPWLPFAIAAALHYSMALRIRFSEPRIEFGERIVPWFVAASTGGFAAAMIWKLAPAAYAGAAWMALGAVLLELGLRRLPEHFRIVSYLVSTLGFADVFTRHILLANRAAGRSQWISLAIGATIDAAVVCRMFRSPESQTGESRTEPIDDGERGWVRDLSAGTATLFVMMLAWLKLPAPNVALAWAVAGLILLELGFRFGLARFRFFGNVVAAAVFGRLFVANFTDLGNTIGIPHRLLTVVPIIVSHYYVWSRYRHEIVSDAERAFIRLYLYAPAILAVVLARFELGRSLAVTGWAIFGLVLYRAGWSRAIGDLRWQSYAIALLAFWRCWNTNFYVPESLGGIRARVLTGAIVIASFYIAQLVSPHESKEGNRIDRHARSFYSLLASALLGVLLFYEVSGGVLTMAWGVEALALLAAGFPLRDRVQRLTGLFLFLVCVLKLFFYDLRQLETINRILSFIVLGVILVSVSWVYTRFRDRIQRYL